MQKEEKDSPITDNKKLQKLKRILDRFDGAALLTMRKLTNEEKLLLVEYINNGLGAWSVVPATRPQSSTVTEEEGVVTVNVKKKSTEENSP